MEDGIGDLVAAFGIDENSDELIGAYKDALVKLECSKDDASTQHLTENLTARIIHVKREVNQSAKIVYGETVKTASRFLKNRKDEIKLSNNNNLGTQSPPVLTTISTSAAGTAVGNSTQNIIRVVGNGGHVMGNFILVKPQEHFGPRFEGAVTKIVPPGTPAAVMTTTTTDAELSLSARENENGKQSSTQNQNRLLTTVATHPGSVGVIGTTLSQISPSKVAPPPSVSESNSSLQSFIRLLPPSQNPPQIFGGPTPPFPGTKQLIILPPSTQIGPCQTVVLTPISQLTNLQHHILPPSPVIGDLARQRRRSPEIRHQSITTMSMASMVGEDGRMKRKFLTKRIAGMRTKVESFIFLWKSTASEASKGVEKAERCVSYVCLECNTPFAHRKDQTQHFGRTDNDMRKVVRCIFCSFSSRNVCSLVAHIRLHRDQPPHTCFLCGFLAKNRSLFHQHLESNHDLNVEVFAMFCLTCSDRYPGVMFENFAAFLNHVQSPNSHRNIKPTHKDIYQCKYCQGLYPNCWAVEQHMMFCKQYPDSFYSKHIPNDTFDSNCSSMMCNRCKVMYFGSLIFLDSHRKSCNEFQQTTAMTTTNVSEEKPTISTPGKVVDPGERAADFLIPDDILEEEPESEGDNEVTTPTKRKTFICQQCKEQFPYKLAYVKHTSAGDCSSVDTKS